MIVGIGYFEIFIPGSRSLKDKRRVVNSLRQKLQRKNLSVAIFDEDSLWKRVDLGVALVSSSPHKAREVLKEVKELIESFSEVVLTQSKLDYWEEEK
jgi:hypothetical protein